MDNPDRYTDLARGHESYRSTVRRLTREIKQKVEDRGTDTSQGSSSATEPQVVGQNYNPEDDSVSDRRRQWVENAREEGRPVVVSDED